MRVVDGFEIAKALEEERREKSIYYPMNEVKDGNITKLYTNLCVPSYVHGYSLAIEYMSKWFEDTYPEENFFKSIYIDGKHVIDDYKKFTKQLVKGENPRARIEPRVQFDYDMETVDLYQAPPWLFLRRSRWQDSFFKDHDRNLYLLMNVRGMRMDFNFKVRVNTRSQQLDTFNKMELSYRVGATQAHKLSVDWHVPKDIMLYIANKAGFAVKDGIVLDIIGFINYLNAHSDIPFLFKLRAINKKPEFFIRVSNLYTHIAIPEKLQMDEGERDGKLDFNFHVEMNAVLTMPVPHFYTLYSADDFVQKIDLKEDTVGSIAIHTINLIDIPKVDEHGWPQACMTDYICDKGEKEVDISGLFTGENILSKTINHDMLLGVNPNHFVSMKIYRDEDLARRVDFWMDWKNKIIHFNDLMMDELIHIVIYYDRNYVNELVVNLNDYNDNRILEHGDNGIY